MNRRILVAGLFSLLAFASVPALAKKGRRGRHRKRGDDDGGEYHDDHERARDARKTGKIQKLSAIIAEVKKVRPGEIVDVSLETEKNMPVYDLVILSQSGNLYKVRVDAVNGIILYIREK